ncbi:MAG: SDR family NAD(P)-dependent oxidoreductase [Proteobacteria bacterium]|nr:SDR family NAD(P)-dependent oxidoreductase [Pseudomonadota bacterium]
MKTGERILVVGATSAIAQEAIRIWAGQGARLFLAGRDAGKLEVVSADAKARGGSTKVAVVEDVTSVTNLSMMVDSAWKAWGGLDGVLVAHGWLPNQREAQDDPLAVRQCLRINGESVCEILTLLAPRFAKQRSGWMAAISSVAGDRGRAAMYVYGAAKAVVSHFMSGLRQRLEGTGVRVIDIRPGPVDTPMTEGLKMPLVAAAEPVARRIVRACAKSNGVVYVPWFWRFIMLILTHVPEPIWVKMKI